MNKLIGSTMLLLGSCSFAFAGAVTAPEIDASSGAAAVGLLLGGMMILRARRKK